MAYSIEMLDEVEDAIARYRRGVLNLNDTFSVACRLFANNGRAISWRIVSPLSHLELIYISCIEGKRGPTEEERATVDWAIAEAERAIAELRARHARGEPIEIDLDGIERRLKTGPLTDADIETLGRVLGDENRADEWSIALFHTNAMARARLANVIDRILSISISNESNADALSMLAHKEGSASCYREQIARGLRLPPEAAQARSTAIWLAWKALSESLDDELLGLLFAAARGDGESQRFNRDKATHLLWRLITPDWREQRQQRGYSDRCTEDEAAFTLAEIERRLGA